MAVNRVDLSVDAPRGAGSTGTESAPVESSAVPSTVDMLALAVESLGGSERSGQVTMAHAVDHAIATGEHLAVQAGTGTGKSLAYLVPALRHAVLSGRTVVVSTATIALQNQLVDRDLPRLTGAIAERTSIRPCFAILKGRGNYLCRHKIGNAAEEEDPEAALIDPAALSRMGREVTRLHEWAQTTKTGDRDDLDVGVSDMAWRQVSVSARECLGASRCPQASDCHAEHAREDAAAVDLVVTNHALLAIDAMTDVSVLPEHDVVVIDEAHELSARVTGVTSGDLTAAQVVGAAKKASQLVSEDISDRLIESGEHLAEVLAECTPGRLDILPQGADLALASVRAAADDCRSALRPPPGSSTGESPEAAAARLAMAAALDDVRDLAERILVSYERPLIERYDVVWLSEHEKRGRSLHVAPLSVAGLLRERLFAQSTVILTSATLTTGGRFDVLAAGWGLPKDGVANPDTATATAREAPGKEPDTSASASGSGPVRADASALRWSGIDVGSPFDHERNAILYVARHLAPPGRDGMSPQGLTEIEELLTAADGRTLGLFSSMRAARFAADELKDRIKTPILCQGDDSTANLVNRFAADPQISLFGTLSLWQGVDVPGPSLSLVIIDRIPFPRPDDPLLSARQRAVDGRGGNGFMSVSAHHAALLLAQGAGRLLRGVNDKGVVAILDPRIATARYGSYLLGSLPPMWRTSDGEKVRSALQRLASAE